MYDFILRAIEQQQSEQRTNDQPSPVEKFNESYSQYQKDLAATGVQPSKEQVYGRPYRA